MKHKKAAEESFKPIVHALLKQQTGEGLFPTYCTARGTEFNETPESLIGNIGIHTYVLETLISLPTRTPAIQHAIQQGLDYLYRDAVEENGRLVWRWLKQPPHKEWRYPADTDDTARARAIIELAQQNGFVVPEPFTHFDYTTYAEEGLTPTGGRLTFDGLKPNNSVCPVTNANLLSVLEATTDQGNRQRSSVQQRITHYLATMIQTREFESSDFSRCSKFYLSHAFLTYLMSKNKEAFDDTTQRDIAIRIEKEEGNYNNPLEAAFATMTLMNLQRSDYLIRQGIKHIIETRPSTDLWRPHPFYQHQRLKKVFGSSVATTTFCLEALMQYEGVK